MRPVEFGRCCMHEPTMLQLHQEQCRLHNPTHSSPGMCGLLTIFNVCCVAQRLAFRSVARFRVSFVLALSRGGRRRREAFVWKMLPSRTYVYGTTTTRNHTSRAYLPPMGAALTPSAHQRLTLTPAFLCGSVCVRVALGEEEQGTGGARGHTHSSLLTHSRKSAVGADAQPAGGVLRA